MKTKFGKILIYSLVAGAAFFAQGCGSNNNAPSTVFSSGGTAYPIGATGSTNPTIYANYCPNGYGAYTVNSVNGPVSVCRVVSGVTYFDQTASIMDLSGSGSNIVASSGLNSGLVVDAGDKLYVWSFGHYSIPGQSGCSGAGPNSNGDTSSIGNNESEQYNGLSAGLWYAFADQNGNYDSPTAAQVQCTNTNCVYSESAQQIAVPGGSATGSSASYNVMLGYNNSSIQCGDMGMYYEIVRCVDSNGLTYPCN